VTNDSGSVTSIAAALTVNTAPEFLVSLGNQLVKVGDDLMYSSVAAGTEPISYQWYRNGSALVGGAAQLPSGTLSNIQTNDAGDYFVTATNLVGMATSSVVTLTVAWPPYIISGPTNQTVQIGNMLYLSVEAGGYEPLIYTWLRDGTVIGGAWLPNLSWASGWWDAADYQVIIENYAGSVTSEVATITVDPPVQLIGPLSILR